MAKIDVFNSKYFPTIRIDDEWFKIYVYIKMWTCGNIKIVFMPETIIANSMSHNSNLASNVEVWFELNGYAVVATHFNPVTNLLVVIAYFAQEYFPRNIGGKNEKRHIIELGQTELAILLDDNRFYQLEKHQIRNAANYD